MISGSFFAKDCVCEFHEQIFVKYKCLISSNLFMEFAHISKEHEHYRVYAMFFVVKAFWLGEKTKFSLMYEGTLDQLFAGLVLTLRSY